jgi:hypothetical protein
MAGILIAFIKKLTGSSKKMKVLAKGKEICFTYVLFFGQITFFANQFRVTSNKK